MPAWNTSGTVLIACNCDWGCPCNFNAPPTKGFCQGGWNWLIETGACGGASLDGLALSVYAAWPGAIHEGGGRAVAYVDARADDAQAQALTRLVRGELGGPWAVFVNTYALEGPRRARYEVELAGHASRLRIGDTVHLELEPIRNPVTRADTHPEMVLPEGLVVKRAALAASKTFRVTGDLAFDHSGQYTAFGRFEYAGS